MALDQPILRVSHPSKVPGHSMHKDWALPERQYSYIALLDLAKKHMPGKRFASAISARSLETGLEGMIFLARNMKPLTQSIPAS